MYVNRYVYILILEEISITNEFIKIVNKMKWGKLLFMKYDAYKNLVYEFYSSLKLRIDAKGNILDYTMNFRLHCKPHSVIPEKFAKWLDCDCEGMLNALLTFIKTGAWVDLGGRETYHSQTFKSIKMKNPIY